MSHTIGYSVTTSCTCSQYQGGGREHASESKFDLTGPRRSEVCRYSNQITTINNSQPRLRNRLTSSDVLRDAVLDYAASVLVVECDGVEGEQSVIEFILGPEGIPYDRRVRILTANRRLRLKTAYQLPQPHLKARKGPRHTRRQ